MYRKKLGSIVLVFIFLFTYVNFPVDFVKAENTDVILVEAENMNLTRYYVEDLTGASDSKIVTMKKKKKNEAIAKYTFNGDDGVYDLEVGYYEGNQAGNGKGSENSAGPTQYWLYIDGNEVDSWGNRGNQQNPNPNIRTINGVTINSGDKIKIKGKRNGHDLAILDYIQIKPAVTQNREKISILEVQPNEKYELDEDMFSYDINLTQMTMAEFICKINDLNGAYDVVYVGNELDHNKGYYKLGDRPRKLPQGGNNGSDSEEYYSGNDITDRRSQKLIDFIESGQLTIFDEDIFHVRNDDTKIFNNFINYRNNEAYNNFITVDENLVSNISSYYSNIYNKRPLLTLNDKPADYTGQASDYMTEKLLEYNFDVLNQNSENRMTAKLYIDYDGDGLFKASDSELVKTVEDIINGDDKVFSYRLPDAFSGLLHWKLEIIDDETGTKAYKDGYTAFKGEEIKVKVLQLAPDGNTFNLSNMDDLLYKEGEFDIDIDVMDFDNFQASFDSDSPVQLNGNYDMIILGFADMYGGEDLTNSDAIQAIKDFIATGQSVMFTHDNMTFRVNGNGWASNLTKEFRDLIGQNIYKYDPLRYSSANEAKADGEYYENRLDFPVEDEISYGFSRLTLDRADKGNFPYGNEAYKLNEGLITVYPYPLEERISIAKTHHQYFQLDLEDEEVIPWYTLYDNRFNEFDGRNDYYTYSKGNITYSGTGHSSPRNKEEENKMFVNTMLKATMGANHAPVLEVYGISDGTGILRYKSDISFSFKVTDMDRQDKYLSTDIFIDADNDGTFEKIKHYSYEDREIENGVLEDVTINKNVSSDIDEFKIKIKAYDKSNAFDEYTVTLQHKDDSIMTLDTQLNANGYLVGDTADVSVSVNPEGENAKNKYSNIILQSNFNSDAFNVNAKGWQKQGNLYTKAVEDVEFREDGTSTWGQSKDYGINLTFNEAGNFDISSTVVYTKYGWDTLSEQWIKNEDDTRTSQTYNIDVKSGKLDVEVTDSDGRGISGIDINVVNADDDSDSYEGETNTNGISSFSNIPSGTYNVSLDVPDEYNYNWDNETEQVVISYDNSQKALAFTLSGEAVNNIEIQDLLNEDSIEVRQTANGPIQEDLSRQIKIDFNIYRELESLGIEFADNLSNSSISNAALYKGDTLVGNLILANGEYLITQNLDEGSYSIKLDYNTGDTIPDNGHFKIKEINFKELQILNNTTINPNDDNSLFINSLLNVNTVEIQSPVSNVWMTTKGGSDTLDIDTDEPIMVTIGFDLLRSVNSLAFSISEDSGNISSLDIDYIESIKYKAIEGNWQYIDSINLENLDIGSYKITLELDPDSALVQGDTFNINLTSINTVEETIGSIDLPLEDVGIEVNIIEEYNIVDDLRILAKVKDSETNYTNMVNVQVVDNILQDSDISVKVKFTLNEEVDSITVPLVFSNIDSVEYTDDIELYDEEGKKAECLRSNNTIKYNDSLQPGDYYIITDIKVSDDVSDTSRIDLNDVTITGDETISYEYNNTAVQFNVEEVTSDVIILAFNDRFGQEQKVTVLKAGNKGRTYLRMDFKVTSEIDFLEYTLSCEEVGLNIENILNHTTPEAGYEVNSINFDSLGADEEYYILFEIEMFGEELESGKEYEILVDPIKVRKNEGDSLIQYSPEPPIKITAKVVDMPSLR